MLIARDKFGNKWEVVKNDKLKTKTNQSSASLMSSKVLLPLNLQNQFSSLIATEESSS